MGTFLGCPWDFGSCLYLRLSSRSEVSVTLLFYETSCLLWLLSILSEAGINLESSLDLWLNWAVLLPLKNGSNGNIEDAFWLQGFYPLVVHVSILPMLAVIIYQHVLLYTRGLHRFYAAAESLFIGQVLCSLLYLIRMFFKFNIEHYYLFVTSSCSD